MLAALQAARMLRCGEAGFRYRYGADGTGELIDRLAGYYASDLVQLTQLIHARTADRGPG